MIAACAVQSGYDERAELLSTSDIEMRVIEPIAATPMKVKRRAASMDDYDNTADGIEKGSISAERRNSVNNYFFRSTNSSGANTPTAKEQAEGGLIENITRRISGAIQQLSGVAANQVRGQNEVEMLELEGVMVNPLMGRMLTYCMNSLDTILTSPFAFLVKAGDPVSIHLAVEYMYANELSNNIYIIHFVDDRTTLHQENALRKLYATKAATKGISDALSAENIEKFEKHRAGYLLKKFSTEHRDIISSTATHEELFLDHQEGGATSVMDEKDFGLRPALHGLPPNAQKIVRIVSVIDTFYMYVDQLL